MSKEVAEKALDLLVKNSKGRKNLEVDFFGGEPLLNFDTVEYSVDYGNRLASEYGKKTGRLPITATMASESKVRTQKWLQHGCNAFDAKKKISNPMSFWVEQDVLLYIYQNHIPIASVYGDVVKEQEVEGQLDVADLGIFDLERPMLKTTKCKRTGCVLCGFGCHMRDDERFLLLKESHPKLYNLLNVAKNNGYTFREAIEWTNEHGGLEIRY